MRSATCRNRRKSVKSKRIGGLAQVSTSVRADMRADDPAGGANEPPLDVFEGRIVGPCVRAHALAVVAVRAVNAEYQ
jgi:hypothetical protein